jgi:sensor domain CHASE-containing protein
MKHNKMSFTERKQQRADGSVVRMFTLESKVTIMVMIMVAITMAITLLLTNAPEMGNSQLEEALLEMMLVMARVTSTSSRS